jgi:hypothetical protein
MTKTRTHAEASRHRVPGSSNFPKIQVHYHCDFMQLYMTNIRNQWYISLITVMSYVYWFTRFISKSSMNAVGNRIGLVFFFHLNAISGWLSLISVNEQLSVEIFSLRLFIWVFFVLCFSRSCGCRGHPNSFQREVCVCVCGGEESWGVKQYFFRTIALSSFLVRMFISGSWKFRRKHLVLKIQLRDTYIWCNCIRTKDGRVVMYRFQLAYYDMETNNFESGFIFSSLHLCF